MLRAMPPLRPDDVICGQFSGHTDEPGVAEGSAVETFVALRAHVDTRRWAGVPFFIRAGKRLPVTVTEVLARLRRAPEAIAGGADASEANYVRFRLTRTSRSRSARGSRRRGRR
ncbi:hypothetical protein [Nonomuraea cypriaca]|uniref:hypothetical protein n=1 Tax=Nonomuraea cypriaca TaxID=1187855 RepID=UPI002E2D9190|nr:hypothetical protein [Nonomuraea cypriaca]